MFFFFLFVSLANLAFGYFVAVKFHTMLFPAPARERELVRTSGELVGGAPGFSIDATQIPIVNHPPSAKTISPPQPEQPKADVEEEHSMADLTLSMDQASSAEKTQSPVDEVSAASSRSAVSAETADVSVDEFMRGISSFRAQLSALDQRIRNCAKSPDSRQIEGCVQEFRAANNRYLEQSSEAKDRLEQADSMASESANSAREVIQQALAMQAQEVRLTEVKLTQLDIEADPEGSCETLLNTAHALANSNDKLRDDISLAKRALVPEDDAEQEAAVPTLDELTQIPSRQMFDVELQRQIKRSAAFYLAVVDVDHCSQLNLSYGPAVTDEVLKAIAKIIAASARGECRAARYSGQQFAVLFPSHELADAAQAVERIRQIIQLTEFKHDETRLDVTVSITVIAGNAGESLQNVEQKLGDGIAKAKLKGGNQSYQFQAGEVELIPPPELDLHANSYEV